MIYCALNWIYWSSLVLVFHGGGFLTLMTRGWSLQNEDDSECGQCPSSVPIWEIFLLWWLKTHSLPISSVLYDSFLRLHIVRNLIQPGTPEVDAELCAIPPLGLSALCSGCGTQQEGKGKSFSFFHGS